MKLNVTKKDTLVVIITGIVLLALALLGRWIRHVEVPIILVAISTCLVVFILLEIHRRNIKFLKKIYENLHNDYKQIEALMFSIPLLEIKHPLPPMGDWAISPDMANILISLILEEKPKFTLDCGSGVSTLLIAYCLKKLKHGTVLSVEQDEKYFDSTRHNIKLHSLEEIASVICAPLKEIYIRDKSWMWYDTAFLRDIKSINLLVVDGPIIPDPYGKTQKMKEMARYPGLPILLEKLSDNCIIVVDDAKREDERKVIETWVKEFSIFECERYNTEKGTVILRRKSKNGNNI